MGAPPTSQVVPFACGRHSRFGTPFTHFVAPYGAPAKAPEAQPACGRLPLSAHPSHASWPQRELQLRLKWHRSHVSDTPVSAHPSHVSWSHTSSS
eukprot:7389619-Pyramimonas_sp.AAC.1